MSIAEMIDAHSRRLPDQAAREALNDIERLEQRYGVQPLADADEDDTEALRVCATVEGELWFGVAKSARVTENTERLLRLPQAVGL